MTEKNIPLYTLHNEDLRLSLKMINQIIEKAENQLKTKANSLIITNTQGEPKHIPNMALSHVKNASESISELRKKRKEIKEKYQQSKFETVLLDLEQIKKELDDKDLKRHLSTVAGITNERPSLKKLLNFENKLKSKNNKEGTESPLTL